MPDLYPKDRVFKHQTRDELRDGILKIFNDILEKHGVGDDPLIKERFKVFCFKHDLEALVLACPDSLKRRVGVKKLVPSWRTPVEDQDHEHPPKRIVEELFARHGKSYQATADAPYILWENSYQDVADNCPQCFKPFVEFLAALPEV